MFKSNMGLQVWRLLSLMLVVVFGVLSILGSSGSDHLWGIGDPYGIADAGPDQNGTYFSFLGCPFILTSSLAACLCLMS
ncbi:MAG: hypothetical protein M3H12_16640, partial [Chromatiales bacterium]